MRSRPPPGRGRRPTRAGRRPAAGGSSTYYAPVSRPDATPRGPARSLSLMVVVRRLQGQPQVGHPRDLLRHDVDHALLVLQAPGDDERGLQVDDEPALLEEPR